jgi:hypothetical protein
MRGEEWARVVFCEKPVLKNLFFILRLSRDTARASASLPFFKEEESFGVWRFKTQIFH